MNIELQQNLKIHQQLMITPQLQQAIKILQFSRVELEEFIDSLTGDQFEGLTEFFDTMPKVQHSVEVTNPKTKKKGEVVIEGIQSFFD